MNEPSIQFRPPHKGAAGFGFEDGERVPIGEAEIFTDEASASGESAQLPPLCLSVDMTFDLIISGSKDSKERDLRLLVLAMKYNHRAAPKTKTELALALDVPRSTGHRLWARLSSIYKGKSLFCETGAHW